MEVQLVGKIVDAARTVHRTLGPGFLESIYSRALVLELRNRGLSIEREKQIKIRYGSQVVGTHRLDLVIEASVIVELKAGRGIVSAHQAQMRSYLHATGNPYGLLLNFGMPELEWQLVEPETAEAQPHP